MHVQILFFVALIAAVVYMSRGRGEGYIPVMEIGCLQRCEMLPTSEMLLCKRLCSKSQDVSRCIKKNQCYSKQKEQKKIECLAKCSGPQS